MESVHIGLRHSYILKLLIDGVINIILVRSCKNLATPLTKGLASDLIQSSSGEWV